MTGKALRVAVVLLLSLLVLLALQRTFFSPPSPAEVGDASGPPTPAPEFDVPPPLVDGGLPQPPPLTDAGTDTVSGQIVRDSAGTGGVDGGSPANHGRFVLTPAARLPSRVDMTAGRARTVEGGRAPELRIDRLLSDGIQRVSGTVEVTGDRKPDIEDGVPVGLTGRVVEAGTDLPVRGAEVVIMSAFYVKRVFYDHHLREVARTVTDADGEYRIDRLNVDPVHFGRGGRVYVSVTSPVHAPHPPIPLDGVTPGFRNRLADAVLSREVHVLRGRVLDSLEGKPVVGGRVVATGEILPIHFPKDQREALFIGAPEAVTDEDGRFEMLGVGPGRQWISVHGGDDCVGYQQVTVPLEGEVVLRARQIRGRIEGTVTDELGRPVPLVKVDGGGNSTHTFADGSFTLENFRGDSISLTFEHPDFTGETVAAVENGATSLVVELAGRWPTIHLRVTDGDTNARISKVGIALAFTEGETPPAGSSPWSLAEDGVHQVRLPTGATSVAVWTDGYAKATLDLTGARAGDIIDVALRRE